MFFEGTQRGMFLYPLRRLPAPAMLTMASAGFPIGMFWNGGGNWRAQKKHTAFVEAQEAGMLSWLRNSLAAVGRMALSN